MSRGTDGLDVELQVTIARAEKQIDQFINSTKKKFEKLNLNPMGGGTGKSGSRGGGSSPTKDYEKDLERMRKFYDKSSKERKKRLDDDVRAEEKAQEKQTKVQERENEKRRKVYEKSRKDREKRLADDEKAEKRSQAQIEKIREDALHRYKLMEIQRNRYGQNANEESLRQRMNYEQRLDEIIRRTNSNNLEQQKRAIQLELAQQRKALDQKVMSERQAAAEALASKNHAQKRASKFNNTMFQVQQAVEDASYAGFRGASNNLALMANQLGGPGGTIALMGLMATTMTPTIAKMIGFGEETKKTTGILQEYTQALIDKRDAELQADVESKTSGPLSTAGVADKKKELKRRREELNLRRTNLQSRLKNNPLQDAYMQAKLREEMWANTDNPEWWEKNRQKMVELGLPVIDIEKEMPAVNDPKTLLPIKAMRLSKESQRMQIEAERRAQTELGKSFTRDQINTKKSGVRVSNMADRFKFGTVKKEELKAAAETYNESLKSDLQKYNADVANFERTSKNIAKYPKIIQETMDMIEKGADNIDTKKFGVKEGPKSIVEKIEQENQALEDKLNTELDRIKNDYEKYLQGREEALRRADADQQEAGAARVQELIKQKETEVTQEMQRQSDIYNKQIEANNQLLSVLEDVKDKHSEITSEIENSVKAHQKKIESLQETLNLTKESYQFDKMSAQSKINEMKIEEQGKKQMTHAQRLANRKFDPMIRYLKFMSQSPVFGQMASQKLQAVEGAKANFLSKAQSKINASVQNKMLKEQQSLLSKQSTFLQDKANAAGGANEFEKQQKYLEQLQSLKMQAAGSAKTPKQAEKYLAQADKIQSQIVQSMNNQISTEKQSLNELTKIESQLIQIKEILKGNPDSVEAKKAQQTLNSLQGKVKGINEGKLPSKVTTAQTPLKQIKDKITGASTMSVGTQFANQRDVLQSRISALSKPSPAELKLQKREKGLMGIDTSKLSADGLEKYFKATEEVQSKIERMRTQRLSDKSFYEKQLGNLKDEYQNIQNQQVTQTQTNQATISHATINSATINGVVNNQKQVPVPVVSGGSSSSNVVNQRFGSLNVNVQGPTLPNIPRALQRQARNSRTRMG